MRTNVNNVVLVAALCSVLGCGASAPEAATPSASPGTTGASGGAAGSVVATKPERNKFVAHLKEHVKYPVSRADLLKACGDTPEFTAGEKRWFETNLPDATYKSADDVTAALKP